VAGPALGVAIAVGGMISAVGMFNSLVLSYSRVPVVLARDGFLPAVFTRLHPRTGAPWVAIIACAIAWSLALRLSLPRLFALDVILYGLSLLLEFAALVVLRVREPQLTRPFRVPGGMFVAVLLGVGPAILIGFAIYDQSGKWEPVEEDEPLAPAWGLILGAILVALGPVIYYVSRSMRHVAPPSTVGDGRHR
jgi:amino acid transporter